MKKKEILKNIKPTAFVISILTIFIFLLHNSNHDLYYEVKFNSDLIYLEKRSMAALSYKENIETIEDLKKYIAEDDKKIEDLRNRGIIDIFLNSYTDLKAFRESNKFISEYNENLWIDYSTQKIEKGIYSVQVSEKTCNMLNERTFKKNRKCVDNIFNIELNRNKSLLPYEFKNIP